MEVILGKKAGFCGGVLNTVNKTQELLKKEKKVFCLGELVHNREVINELENMGLVTIDDINKAEEGAVVIIRAHGESPETYKQAKLNNIKLVDLTCPKVLNIHKKVEELVNAGNYIFLIAEDKHPEIIGTYGYCMGSGYVINKEEDIINAIEQLKESNKDKVAVISQTTFSMSKFDFLVEQIKEQLLEHTKLDVFKTICNATSLRQEEAQSISRKVDAMIVIGGKNSSNTQKLFEISLENCSKAILIENVKDLNKDELEGYEAIGVIAGASTPKHVIDEVIYELTK